MLPNTSFVMHIPSRLTFRLESSPPSLPEGKYEPRGTGEAPRLPAGTATKNATTDLVDPPSQGRGDVPRREGIGKR